MKVIMMFVMGFVFLYKVSFMLLVFLLGGGGVMCGGGFVCGVVCMVRFVVISVFWLGVGVGWVSLFMVCVGGGVGCGLLSVVGMLMELLFVLKVLGVLG